MRKSVFEKQRPKQSTWIPNRKRPKFVRFSRFSQFDEWKLKFILKKRQFSREVCFTSSCWWQIVLAQFTLSKWKLDIGAHFCSEWALLCVHSAFHPNQSQRSFSTQLFISEQIKCASICVTIHLIALPLTQHSIAYIYILNGNVFPKWRKHYKHWVPHFVFINTHLLKGIINQRYLLLRL